jgi:hypothetical protein
MDYRIIKAPTLGTYSLLQRRIDPTLKVDISQYEAIGLMQGKLCDMVFACDVAEKASGVNVFDIRGNCPQNLIMIAVLGDTASVETALECVALRIADQNKAFLR